MRGCRREGKRRGKVWKGKEETNLKEREAIGKEEVKGRRGRKGRKKKEEKGKR